MPDKAVIYKKLDHVALVALNRPDAMNSSNFQLRADLLEAFEQAEQDDDIRTVVLTGEGRGFSAGADLRESFTEHHSTVEQHIIKDHKPLIHWIRKSTKTYIAAINGAAAGVSVGYALTCDLIVIAESAFVYSPFAAISLIPDGGVTWHLTQYLGRARAYEMIITNGRLSAQEALGAGMVNKVLPDDGFRQATLDWAKQIAENTAPLSLRYAKQAVWAAAETGWENTLHKEAALQNHCVGSADNKEGAAAFLEKRKPVFQGK